MLSWLRQLLGWQVKLTRHLNGALADDVYRGLYIPDVEADLLLAETPLLPDDLLAERRSLAILRDEIEEQAVTAERAGVDLPLLRVRRLFELSAFETDVLLLALAPELDLGFERLYAYIQDDVTRKRPAVDLALRLFCADPGTRAAARAAFAPEASLRRHRLIQLVEDGQRHPPLLARFVKLDERIVAELLAQPAVDPLLASFVVVTYPRRSADELVLPAGFFAPLRRAIADQAHGSVLALMGGYGSGRSAIAETLCAELRIGLLKVDVERMLSADLAPREATQRVVREAILGGHAIIWQGVDRMLHDDGLAEWRLALLAALDDNRARSFLPIDRPWEARGALRSSTFLSVALPAPSYTERERLWRLRLNGDRPDDATLDALASTFRLSGGQIRDAVAMARSLASWRGVPLGPDDFFAACRAQSSGKLNDLARKITSTYDWNDIVLPADQLALLREMCAQIRNRRTVLEHWGFDRHLAMGKGLNVLFAGQSGTGKTMAADIIAADLGLELYKVDLSTIVSKYIGETEKNLDLIFTAAREANAILFFDEADSIFGKRSEVKDAHDRYANIEVGYLLQKMEEYDGVVILATNLRKNMDDAFIRRLHAAIDFPFPEEADRARIWRKVFPAEAPLAEDLDLQFMARQFKLAGGSIRNIALAAAYLAAETGERIGMAHLVHATRREYQKMGKLITEADFGRYLNAVKRIA